MSISRSTPKLVACPSLEKTRFRDPRGNPTIAQPLAALERVLDVC